LNTDFTEFACSIATSQGVSFTFNTCILLRTWSE